MSIIANIAVHAAGLIISIIIICIIHDVFYIIKNKDK
tara:strand:- start:1704 stop:1814 length:111 start_codon:yes stop_codon:yes gene_type:complete